MERRIILIVNFDLIDEPHPDEEAVEDQHHEESEPHNAEVLQRALVNLPAEDELPDGLGQPFPDEDPDYVRMVRHWLGHLPAVSHQVHDYGG